MTQELLYPITLDYVPDWGAWECIRELATNALDADSGFKMYTNTVPSPDVDEPDTHDLIIESKGYMVEKHLLLGVSEKESNNAIGQFGEGMKLAMLVLTRMNLTAHIYSNGKHFWNMPAEMSGEPVFKIVWEECDGPKDTTAITIINWSYPTYEERFVRPGDPRVLYTDPFGRMILKGDGDPQLFVKGVWTQKARLYGSEFAFGYNLTDIEMNRDRSVVDSWACAREIGKIWASVTDADLLDQFWTAVQDNMGERDANMSGANIENKKAHKNALQRVYGRDVVVATDSVMKREAEHRGAHPVSASEFGFHLKEVAKDLVGTDEQHVKELEGKSKIKQKESDLRDDVRDRLKLARRLARRAGFSGRITPYILPENVCAEYQKGNIRIGIQQLDSDEKALRSVLHEIGHHKGGQDNTEAHLNAALDAAVKIILSYARR